MYPLHGRHGPVWCGRISLQRLACTRYVSRLMAKEKRTKLLEELIKNPAAAESKAAELKGLGVTDPSSLKTAKEILDDPDGADRSAQFAKLAYPLKLALLDELAKEGAANFLARLQRDEKDKGTGKAIAKAIHECRAQGVKVADLREKKSVAFDYSSDEAPVSYLSPIDTEGNRLALLARMTPLGRLNVFHAVCGDTQGLGNFEGMAMTRASYRRFLQMAEAQMQVALAPIPGDWAAWLIAEAARTATAAGLPLPAAYEQAKTMIEPPATAPQNPLRTLLDEKEVAGNAKELVAKSASLHTMPECAFWVPDEATLEALAEKTKAADESKIAVNEEQRKDSRLHAAREVAKSYWNDERRKLWAGRLEGTALVLAATGRHEDAKLAWATAMDIGKSGEWEKIPFATELFEKIVRHGAIDPHAGHDHAPGEHGKVTREMREAAKDEAADGLIVKP